MVYLYFKLVTWSQKPDIDLMFAIEENAFYMTEKFGVHDGFNVAAALTGYDEAWQNNDDPTYGKLEMRYHGWGNDVAQTVEMNSVT